MTSDTGLVSPSRDHRRTSQHLRTADPRLGSRSPNSIPSSPTSIHSSSSAIFERDIEPIVPPSPPGSNHHTHPSHPPTPHRIPRAKGTQDLEQAVPLVLDSAAAILGSLDTSEGDFADQVSIVAPAQCPAYIPSSFTRIPGSGFASPIESFRSRSPSPLGSRITSPTSVLGLHNVGLPSPHSDASAPLPGPSPSGSSLPRPQMQRDDTTTTITGFSSPSSLGDVGDVDQPLSIIAPFPDRHQHQDAELQLSEPALSAVSTSTPPSLSQRVPQAQHSNHSPSSPSTLSPTHSHPPSPLHASKKRLSFMSYADLLSSTPASLQPLSSLTTSASSADPPPHIPGVSGLNIVSAMYAQGVGSGSPIGSPMLGIGGGSATPSLRSISIGLSLPINALSLPLPVSSSGPVSVSSPNQIIGLGLGPQGGVTHPGKRDSIAMLDNLGGEWEREGLGRGMEQQLEELELFDLGMGVEGGPGVFSAHVPVVGVIGGGETVNSEGRIGSGSVGG